MKATLIFPLLCGAAMLADDAGKVCQAQTKPATKPTTAKPIAKPATTKPQAATIGNHKQANSRTDDEKALRKSAADFAKAYNERDAKALAAQFAPQAEMVDLDGNVIQGREAIEKSFAEQFEKPVFKMAVEIESLRFVGDNLAVEDGNLTLTNERDDVAVRSRYTAVQVREGGRWLVASSRDVANPTDRVEPHQHLRQLEWLLGNWVEESGHSIVVSSCRWDESKNFLLTDYTVKVAGQTAMSGTQRIGWDPLTRQIKTWTFDNDGGYGEGYWHRDGDRWLVKLNGVSADGRAGSMTQVHRRLSDHRRTWCAVERVLGGEPLDDIEEITVVRAAPKPKLQPKTSGKSSTKD
jgi:uncharacterized protein (TIGR02246 family)